MKTNTLSPERSRKMGAYWRAANSLSVGQIDLEGACSKIHADIGNALRRRNVKL